MQIKNWSLVIRVPHALPILDFLVATRARFCIDQRMKTLVPEWN